MSESTPSGARLLLIGTDATTTSQVEQFFTAEGMTVAAAGSAAEGLAEAARQRPDLVLLAVTLGDEDGLRVYKKLRQNPNTGHIPVMFIADYRDAPRQNELLAAGADDVIMAPVDVEILGLRVRNAIKRTQREGLTDPRTGLPTGPLLQEQLAAAGEGHARLEIDIAHFDAFRARYDFITGDEALRFAARAVCEVVDEMGGGADFVGHHGGTRFVVLTDAARCDALIDALRVRVGEGLGQFYNFMEREQGYILLEDDQGAEQHPLMHLVITKA